MLTGMIKDKIKKAVQELFEEYVKNAKLEIKFNPETSGVDVKYKKEF